MIEPLKNRECPDGIILTPSWTEMIEKINELVDWANDIDHTLEPTDGGEMRVVAETAEKTEQLTTEDLTRDDVVRYLNQHPNLSSTNPIDRAYVQRAIDLLMGKVEKMYTPDEVAEMMWNFFGTGPCDFNGIDETVDNDKWCMKHCEECGGCGDVECWKHAIQSGWLKG